MRIRGWLVVFMLAAVVVGSLPAAAQTDLHDWTNVENVAVGAELWVKTTHGSYTGVLQAATGNELVIVRTRRFFFIPISREFRLQRGEVREVRYSRRGWSKLIGTAIGAGAGIGLGLIAESTARNQSEDGHIVAATLGILGGAMGAGIGEQHQIVKGKKIYVAP